MGIYRFPKSKALSRPDLQNVFKRSRSFLSEAEHNYQTFGYDGDTVQALWMDVHTIEQIMRRYSQDMVKDQFEMVRNYAKRGSI